MEDSSSTRVPGLSTPRSNNSSPKMFLHSPAPHSPASNPPTNSYSSASQSPSSQYSSAPHSPASQSPAAPHSPAPHSPAPHSPTLTPTASPLPVGLLQDLDSSEAAKQLISLGPGLAIGSKVFQRIKAKKVGSYVANIMSATLSREYMATHSYKGQKAKNGLIKPKIDLEYASSMIAHCKSIKFSDMGREVIEEDIVKAIKYKLNNEEQGWKKQNESDNDGTDKD